MAEPGGAISWLKAAVGAAAKKETAAAANLDFAPFLPKVNAQINDENRRISQREYHQNYETARKLAALFQDLWPDTPNLIRTYRHRVLEIYKLAKDDTPEPYLPESTFSSLVGLDTFRISASPTVPESLHKGVVQMHLLACFLAHACHTSGAIFTWYKLIEQRRQQITSDIEKGIESPSSTAAAAAKQDISWPQISFWNCNARAWLQMAQVVMMKEETKVEQALKNVELPVKKSSISDFYRSVIPTWLSGLATLENVVLGRPQEEQDGDILRVISAWNLYPDFYVFGSKNTEAHFNDRLVPRKDIIIIGCDPGARAPSNNMFRSLSLSQL
ncbi:hypothetical protein CEP54_014730 [Fusarium duplospermum]|uniref:Uncharacterized protein n=1 Tax=Fusarium duplospermum TaxID=1325734 RepID=A0A428NU96_9HYPO|nr:hypothetical protein CEP54_014730 [Fusarium duplospermum]